jgi:NAD(P)-dependent dehydrogenase (short-subunit alcohol dehydrogenase family)
VQVTTPPNFDLSGKVAIITGASKGIGEAIAQTYAAAGASVVLSSRRQKAIDAVAARIRDAGGRTLAVAAHTGSQEAVDNLVRQAVETFGGVDIVVNNAATNPHFGQLLTAEESVWDKTIDVNLKGYARVIKAVLPSLKERGGGKVINVASVAGLSPAPMMGVYGITKAGVLMMTKILANELAPDNVQVNAIAPGFIKTKFSAAIWTAPQIAQIVEKATPMGRIASVDELTGIALYLASSASSFTTGATFVVDGGLSVNGGMSFG